MRMALFILRRLVLLIPIMIGITLIVFVMTRVLPSDPLYAMLGPFATNEEVAQKRVELGFDQPLPVQYVLFLQNLLRGDFGYAYRSHSPVSQDLAQRFPVTFELTTLSLLLAVVIGVPLGVQAA